MDKRKEFLRVMREELSKYPWAQDSERLENTMVLVEETMTGSRKCMIDGSSWKAAWRAIGEKSKLTYTALRSVFAQPGTSL
jgi:hypothetical protein